jgi:DNA repair protein RecO (recombination protein O)
LLEIEASNRGKSNIRRIKEYKFAETFTTIPFDIKKTSIAMFIAEVLYKTIREEEPNAQLFDFIYHSILIFDKIDKGSENFHLHFLANLSKHIGFFPDIDEEISDGFFDIKKGKIYSEQPKHLLFFDKKNTQNLRQLLNIQASNICEIELNRKQRESFLNSMLDFYNYHFDKLSPIKSLKVFTEVFKSE